MKTIDISREMNIAHFSIMRSMRIYFSKMGLKESYYKSEYWTQRSPHPWPCYDIPDWLFKQWLSVYNVKSRRYEDGLDSVLQEAIDDFDERLNKVVKAAREVV